jgi:hypothetical protein
MIGLFKRAAPGTELAALGQGALALRMPSGALVPPGCAGVAVGKGAATRRVEQGGRIVLNAHEQGFCFHPGPYSAELTPFAAAPELGLRLSFVVDSPRFDLYLASEAGDSVQLASFASAIDTALQRELAQGNLELPPCTSVDEWHRFRAGLNQLLYQRFGATVEDCVPVDLGERVDFARVLLQRAAAAPVTHAVEAKQALVDPVGDAQALRRLFLELPGVTSALRLLPLPAGQALFRQHQALLQRLDRASLLFDTMPALALAAPGQALSGARQAERADHSRAAVAALDEAWALVARFPAATDLAAWFDDADRIVANLEHHGAGRRAGA